MNPEIFREYDIRGIAGEDMDEADVYRIGQGIAAILREKGCRRLVVGRDCRLSSRPFAEKLVQGLLGCGCDVTQIGVCPTPVLYFAIHHLKKEGGVMVTASHNPKEYNGFKICHGLDSVHGKDIRRIPGIIQSGQFPRGEGLRDSAEVIPAYTNHLIENIQLPYTLRIGVDGGNGTAGPVAVPLLKRLGCEVHPLYCEPDGNFPNHEADPTVLKNMADLVGMVKERGLDLGIGYDGDGDRIGVVDEHGDIVYGDRLMILFAREILTRKPGATFIGEVKCSKVLYDDIQQRGGRAIMWKTGHSLIKQKMKQEDAALAGEMSGHMFFADRYLGYDDAIYASCRLLELVADSRQHLSRLLSDLPNTYTTPEIRMECPDSEKFELVRQVHAYLRRRNHDVIDIDGVRVTFEDGWGLIRASNTQPALVLRFEAQSKKRLAAIRHVVESALEAVQRSK